MSRQTTQWQESLQANRTPQRSCLIIIISIIIDTYLCTPQFYQGQSRRSCRCNSHQSDPCHRACNHPATWKYFRLKNILGHFFAFHVLTRPRFHKRRTLGRYLERTMGSSSRESLTGLRFVLCLYSYLFCISMRFWLCKSRSFQWL